MRARSVLLLLLSTFMVVMAVSQRPSLSEDRFAQVEPDSDSVVVGTLPDDSLSADTLATDTTQLDSLHQAIFMHNKQIDDSIRADSLQRARQNGIDAPVEYTAKDSMVYDAQNRTAYLYGGSTVDYQNMNLQSQKIYLSLDSSLVRATGVKDSTAENGVEGSPVFKMGNDEYQSDTMAYNFKSKKGLIRNVYTEQQEGYLTGERSKRDSSGVIYIQHARYTTCDKPDPDFYIALSRAKVRPNKDVVFGPAYLVVADVPLPLAIPYGFFPFTKSYSSGFIMPTYGDENSRGFYLRDGGYYFAINDIWDLKVLGEIYTKGSWGLSAASNYRKRYKYSGSFYFSYQNTQTGDKGMPDFAKQESFKVQWSHRQDSKANPFSSLAASVNFATTSYERNNLTGMYNPQALTQSTRTSSVSWSTQFSSIGMTLSATTNLNQNMRDSSINLTLPDLNVSIARFYPFRRKHVAGNERWYEKISMSYTGTLSNSIATKEDQLLHSDLVKDWRNGMQHVIPVQGNFTLFKYINVSPQFRLTDRMYSHKVNQSWDEENQEVKRDTVYGFNNVYNWNMSLSANTKIYGMWTPNPKIFGDKIIAVRHVLTPSVSFSYAPDFGAAHYGYWKTYQRTDADGNVTLVNYSPYEGSLYGTPGRGKTGSLSFSVDNNIEMKVRSDKDSTGFKKLSIIDNLGWTLGYNFAAETRPWSDLSVNLRLKWWKNYTFNMQAVFATYAYELDESGHPYVGTHTEWSKGRFGRFQGMSQNLSFTLNPEKLKKWFGGGGDDEENVDDGEGTDTDIESNIDPDMERGKHAAKRKGGGKAETDEDGYMTFSMPWSLTFGYGITMRESSNINKFNYKRMRYGYEFTQTLNVSGNVRISEGWNISFSSGYDFDNHKVSMTTASLSRDLHCFNMSCSVVLAPYTSYNFTFRCNASTLTDALKYDKRSSFSNAIQWY